MDAYFGYARDNVGVNHPRRAVLPSRHPTEKEAKPPTSSHGERSENPPRHPERSERQRTKSRDLTSELHILTNQNKENKHATPFADIDAGLLDTVQKKNIRDFLQCRLHAKYPSFHKQLSLTGCFH